MDIFVDDADREFYLAQLRRFATAYGLDIWAYCLMTNHVHFIAVPANDTSLSRAFHDLHTVYTMRFNQRTGECGHLFQGRFFSTVLDETDLWAAVRYVERNPVRAGLVDRAEEYRWSSARAHVGTRDDPVLAGDFPPEGVVENWREWLGDEEVESSDAIRRCTRTGRACGSMPFLERLERVLEHSMVLKKRGRPKGRKN